MKQILMIAALFLMQPVAHCQSRPIDNDQGVVDAVANFLSNSQIMGSDDRDGLVYQSDGPYTLEISNGPEYCDYESMPQEDLDAFLRRFFNDRKFQFSRIHFPLDEEDMGPGENYYHVWTLKQWKFRKYTDRAIDEAKIEPISEGKEISVIFMKESSTNEREAIYDFRNVSGKWILVHYLRSVI